MIEKYKLLINKEVKIIKKINDRDFYYNGIIKDVYQGRYSIIIKLYDFYLKDDLYLDHDKIEIIPKGDTNE